MTYLIAKHVHVTAVVLSISLFLLRGVWMVLESGWLQKKPVLIVPHIIDTVLLVSAIVLVIQLHQYPFVSAWLTAKVLALVLYIVLGSIALKRGRTKPVRIAAFVAASLTFAYIVAVALTHDPVPWRSL